MAVAKRSSSRWGATVSVVSGSGFYLYLRYGYSFRSVKVSFVGQRRFAWTTHILVERGSQ